MMKIIFIVLGLMFSSTLFCEAQDLTEVQQRTNNSDNLLSPGEILILNSIRGNLSVSCSYNKKTWKDRVLRAQTSYTITLPREKAFLYVEICQESSAGKSCNVYRVAGSMRYVIKLNDDENKLTIVKAYDNR